MRAGVGYRFPHGACGYRIEWTARVMGYRTPCVSDGCMREARVCGSKDCRYGCSARSARSVCRGMRRRVDSVETLRYRMRSGVLCMSGYAWCGIGGLGLGGRPVVLCVVYVWVCVMWCYGSWIGRDACRSARNVCRGIHECGHGRVRKSGAAFPASAVRGGRLGADSV